MPRTRRPGEHRPGKRAGPAQRLAQQLDGLALFMQPAPALPHAPDSDTSRAAADAQRERAALLRGRVLRKFVEAAGGGLTADEAARLLDESVLAIRPRVTELKQLDYLEDSGVRRRNASGHSARVLVATQLGRRVAARPAQPADPRRESAA